VTAIRQGTDEWLEARRSLITATDLPVILGLSPYKCEADLADEKAGKAQEPPSLRMRAGLILEGLIAEAYTEQTGRKVLPAGNLVIHPDLEWAAATPDFLAYDGDGYGSDDTFRIVEAKRTSSRSRFADGLPQDIEAQVVWQLGVTGYPVADVAALIGDDRLEVFTVEANPALFADLVAVAEDFRRRLEAGGPFARDGERVRREFPVDNGVYIPPTPDLVELVEQYRAAKATKTAAEEAEKTIGNALRAIIQDASGIDGLVTYKKNADSTRTNWPAVAKAYRMVIEQAKACPEDELRGQAFEILSTDLDAVESIHTDTSQGARQLRLLKGSTE
jgi:putative phage-type endonuclease